jgi:hypothetical protein
MRAHNSAGAHLHVSHGLTADLALEAVPDFTQNVA